MTPGVLDHQVVRSEADKHDSVGRVRRTDMGIVDDATRIELEVDRRRVNGGGDGSSDDGPLQVATVVHRNLSDRIDGVFGVAGLLMTLAIFSSIRIRRLCAETMLLDVLEASLDRPALAVFRREITVDQLLCRQLDRLQLSETVARFGASSSCKRPASGALSLVSDGRHVGMCLPRTLRVLNIEVVVGGGAAAGGG